MTKSVYKLNKQGDSIQPWHTAFPIWNQSIVSCTNCCFLTCTQVSQEAGKVVWYSHFFKNFTQFVVIHTVRGFSLVNEAEVHVFLEFSCFFYDPVFVGNLIYDSSAFSKFRLYIWKFTVHVLLKPNLKDFEYYLASMWDEHNIWKYLLSNKFLGGEKHNFMFLFLEFTCRRKTLNSVASSVYVKGESGTTLGKISWVLQIL